MGLPSVFIAYITVYVKDAVAVQKQGFLGGYTGIVWTVIIVQAVGGLIVATVVKVRFIELQRCFTFKLLPHLSHTGPFVTSADRSSMRTMF